MSDAVSPEIKRGPGRPPRQEQVQKERRRRQSVGPDSRLKLFVPEEAKDNRFEYRWANNRPGRIQQLTQMDDWDVVSEIDIPSESIGTTVKRTVDKADGVDAVLVRKPREYYEADKAEQQEKIKAQEEQVRRASLPSPEGLSGPEAYVPGGRNVIGR